MNHENLIKAGHGASFLRESLREALSTESNIAALLLLPLIGQVAEIENQISAIFEALESTTAERLPHGTERQP